MAIVHQFPDPALMQLRKFGENFHHLMVQKKEPNPMDILKTLENPELQKAFKRKEQKI